MALASLRLLRAEASCPICLDYLVEPVTILPCGHNFCQECLGRCWEGGGQDSHSAPARTCPQCRQPSSSTVGVNRQLARLAGVARQLSLEAQGEEEEAEKGGPACCPQHQEPLKLFCKEDRSPICVICRESRSHRSHAALPLEEAAEEYKDSIQKEIDVLKKQKDEMAGANLNRELESQSLLGQINAERRKMIAEFRKLQQLVEGRRDLLLARLGELDQKVSKSRDVHDTKLSKEGISLDNLIQEMEEKCQQPASEFLQDIKSILQRYETMSPKTSVTFPPEIKHQIEEFSNINTFLQRVMSQFEETFVSEYQLWKEDIVLDPDTAHPDLSLSEDHRSLRLSSTQLNLPDNPKRFDTSTSVLGREGFISGKHWWEVEVEERGVWAVGVARSSVQRKGPVRLCPEEGIWAVGQMWGGHYQALTSPKHHLMLNRKLRKIRVTVDYENGKVDFLDPDRESPIYIFSIGSFVAEEVLPWFWVGGLASQLRLSL